VVGTPRRLRLGGVCDGAAVDDGGVGPWPARPNDPTASALCRLVRCLRCGQVSLGNRSYARHGRRGPAGGSACRSTVASGSGGAEGLCASPHALAGRLRKEESR
jgi:hypothetical protein